MHRRLIVAALAVLLLLGVATPSGADGSGDALNNGDQIGAGAHDPGSQGGSSGGNGGPSPCRYERMDEALQRRAESLGIEGRGPSAGSGPGAFYRRICDTGNGQTSATVVWLPDPVAVDPAQLAQDALDRTPIPAPEVHLNPSAGQDQVVNVPTWMWVDPGAWQPVSATASAGAVTVTTTAAPSTVRWDMGNGDVVECRGPGTPYDPSLPPDQQNSDCTYTYRHSSAGQPGGAFTITVTTTWDVSWIVTGAPGGGNLGTSLRTATVSVRVAEIQALNG